VDFARRPGALRGEGARPQPHRSARAGRRVLLGHACPNFYFHVTTAYNILRANGVDIGKRDYIGTP
jgi:hypothetical protein